MRILSMIGLVWTILFTIDAFRYRDGVPPKLSALESFLVIAGYLCVVAALILGTIGY